ncbi:hypothetical protein Hypma_014882 [Hypsizygus marmoreus]|uniref:Uncharacterized protein n=1 Tax=Hypsizygus marmoreus TaxID=39966 RepID=A0A369K7C9_HYPMA|nr:hypothetical protein Hypma_014882 [Hypsizygus marmoreus]
MTLYAAHTATDQVDDILDAFYMDEQSPEDSEEEDIAFYDLYEDSEQTVSSRGSPSPVFDGTELDEPSQEDSIGGDKESDSLSSTTTKRMLDEQAGSEIGDTKLENNDPETDSNTINSNKADEATDS